MRSIVVDYLVLVFGTLLLSASYAYFLVPAKISSDGVSGLAIVAHYLFGWPTGLLIFVLVTVATTVLGEGFSPRVQTTAPGRTIRDLLRARP